MRERFRDPREQVRGRSRRQFRADLEEEMRDLQRRKHAEAVLGLERPDRHQAIVSRSLDTAVEHAMEAMPDDQPVRSADAVGDACMGGGTLDGTVSDIDPSVACDLDDVAQGLDPTDDSWL